MRVSLVAAFAGGAFHQAEALARCGVLEKFITTLPAARRLKVPREKVSLHLLPEILARAGLKLPWVRGWYPWENVKALTFGAIATREIGDEDIVVSFSMFGLEVHRKAHRHGAITIIERGSSHILNQRRIVDEEMQRWGRSDRRFLYDRVIARQLLEYEEADYVVVNSHYSWNSFLNEGYPVSKLLRVPLGIDCDVYHTASKRDDVFRIMCVGEGPRKGVNYLLESVRQLALPNSDVVWVGFSGYEPNPFAMKYRDWFTPVGKVPSGELYRYYTQASVVVVPSLEDGWCFVVTEAMACGIPVICTDQTGAAEVIREGIDGFVIPARDVERLKEALLYLYEHGPERQEMGRAALACVKEMNWQWYGDLLMSEYSRVLTGKREGGGAVTVQA